MISVAAGAVVRDCVRKGLLFKAVKNGLLTASAFLIKYRPACAAFFLPQRGSPAAQKIQPISHCILPAMLWPKAQGAA